MNVLTTAIQHWIAFGALTGGAISGFDKFVQIGNEPEPVYNNPTFEKSIRAVYHISRIAGHAGFGSAIGGFTGKKRQNNIVLFIFCTPLHVYSNMHSSQ